MPYNSSWKRKLKNVLSQISMYQKLTPHKVEDSDADWKPHISNKYGPKLHVAFTMSTEGSETKSR